MRWMGGLRPRLWLWVREYVGSVSGFRICHGGYLVFFLLTSASNAASGFLTRALPCHMCVVPLLFEVPYLNPLCKQMISFDYIFLFSPPLFPSSSHHEYPTSSKTYRHPTNGSCFPAPAFQISITMIHVRPYRPIFFKVPKASAQCYMTCRFRVSKIGSAHCDESDSEKRWRRIDGKHEKRIREQL